MLDEYFKLLIVYVVFITSLSHAQSDSSNGVPNATLLPTLQISSPRSQNASKVAPPSKEPAKTDASILNPQNSFPHQSEVKFPETGNAPEGNHQNIDKKLNDQNDVKPAKVDIENSVKSPLLPTNDDSMKPNSTEDSDINNLGNEIKTHPKDNVENDIGHTPSNNESDEGADLSNSAERSETKLPIKKTEDDQVDEIPSNMQDERKTTRKDNKDTVAEPNSLEETTENGDINIELPTTTGLPEDSEQSTTTNNSSEDVSDLSPNTSFNNTVNETTSTEESNIGVNPQGQGQLNEIKELKNATNKVDHSSSFQEASHKNASLTDENDVKKFSNNSDDGSSLPLNHTAVFPVGNDTKSNPHPLQNSTLHEVSEETTTSSTPHVFSTTQQQTSPKMSTAPFMNTSDAGFSTTPNVSSTESGPFLSVSATTSAPVEQTTTFVPSTTMPINKRIRTPPVNPPEAVTDATTPQATTTTTPPTTTTTAPPTTTTTTPPTTTPPTTATTTPPTTTTTTPPTTTTTTPRAPVTKTTGPHLGEPSVLPNNKTTDDKSAVQTAIDYANDLLKKYGPGRIAAIVSVIVFALILFLCCLCRCRKRRKYSKLRKLRLAVQAQPLPEHQYGQENDFLLTDRKAKGIYQSDRMTLLDDSSEDEL